MLKSWNSGTYNEDTDKHNIRQTLPLGFSNFAGSAGVTKSLPKVGGNNNQDIC